MACRTTSRRVLSVCLALGLFPGPSFASADNPAVKVLGQEKVFDGFETKTNSEKRTVSLPDETRVTEVKAGNRKAERVDRDVLKDETSNKGAYTSTLKTVRLTEYRQDCVKRTVQRFQKYAEQQRTIDVKTPIYKIVEHCSEEKSGIRYENRTRKVSGTRTVTETVLVPSFASPPPPPPPILVPRTENQPVTKTRTVTKYNIQTVTVPVIKTRTVTAYREEIRRYPVDKVRYETRVDWINFLGGLAFGIAIWLVRPITRVVAVHYTQWVSYTVSVPYAVQESYSVLETKTISTPYLVQETYTEMVAVTVMVELPRKEIYRDAKIIWEPVTITKTVPYTYDRVYQVAVPYDYTDHYDRVIGRENGATTVTVSNWTDLGVGKKLIETKEEDVWGAPYPSETSVVTEGARTSNVGISKATMATKSKVFTSNVQIGRGSGQVVYIGAAERRNLGIDQIKASEIRKVWPTPRPSPSLSYSDSKQASMSIPLERKAGAKKD